MKTFRRTAFPILIAALIPVASAAWADGNSLILLQDSSASSLGNTLSIDQSGASNSLVAGSLDLSEPALQRGGGNSGEIVLEGEGATVLFTQDNSQAGSLSGNTATIFGGEFSSIVLQQIGDGNTGMIDVSGLGASGELYQKGNGNTGAVLVDGDGAEGVLTQQGNSNNYTLSVSGAGASVRYEQIGSNMTSASGIGPTVFSNGGTVLITQTQLP